MKKHLKLIVLCLFSIQSAHSQITKNDPIYASFDINLGNYIGIDVNLNYIYQQKYSFKIGYTANKREALSQPADYSAGLGGLFSLGLAQPYDHFDNYQIGVGRIYKLNESGTIRANLSIGLGYTIIREPENWKYKSNYSWSENYTYTYSNLRRVSLIINPKIEFPFTKYYGLSLAPMLQINRERTFIGIGVGQMIGLLRYRKSSLHK